MKKIFKVIAVISVVLLVGSIALHKQCDKPIPIEPDNEFQLPVDTYRPPLVRIPFTKAVRMPVERKKLPIPIKDIDKTIRIGEDVVIVIDKKGKIYTTKDTPKDIPIKVTVWKPRLMAFQSEWGASLIVAIPPDMSFALSWDTIRVWKLHFGLDLGAKLTNAGVTDVWLGASVKYKILPKNNLFALVGYNWTHETLYIGVTIRF